MGLRNITNVTSLKTVRNVHSLNMKEVEYELFWLKLLKVILEHNSSASKIYFYL